MLYAINRDPTVAGASEFLPTVDTTRHTRLEIVLDQSKTRPY